ncbi:phosphoribosylglycinamide formyltransferase [Lysinibacillus sp. 2017]|uniref:phosphoribosylglycinamide formyltransferase n=1 Tax=unclassified Lysinibacillus TaxID=2636778 RepID=UPI000D529DC1|nr:MULTISPECIES: phosphoribosylglycinamide formyltransferase [unclassified Lysinibacillus]AWE08847.1 phosphoribosylglycinamide formyltransferase [Lysinibacillus sp. 2017]TGN36170.1 phosphoribosylglycinamide formyltransferase [Lysinibacillus sp. S2017]
MTTKIAVFASGSGSNFQAIQEAIERGELNASIELVITDKPGAYVVTRAGNFGIEVLELAPKSFETKAAYEAKIVEALQEKQIEWVILAGYMLLIGDTLLSAYESRIINIHPSLLPSFPGKDAIGQAINHGVKLTGVTVHYVDAGMDTGKIIAQGAVDVVDGDREKTEQRIHILEHALYTKTLQQLFTK